MKRRANANTWILAGLLTVLVLVGLDVGRRYLWEAAHPEQLVNPTLPLFKVGEVAPDFELPDKAGKKHKLSQLVKRDTILSFLCGCNNCRAMQTYLAQLIKLMGPSAPDLVGVTTQNEDFEERYGEITGLPQQKLLYEAKNGEVMEEYKGHPCPRFYRLDGERKVVWIGPSPLQMTDLTDMSYMLATALGFRNEGEVASDKPLAPRWQATGQLHPTNPQAPPRAPSPGSSPDFPTLPDMSPPGGNRELAPAIPAPPPNAAPALPGGEGAGGR
jgi:hypothetical protein